MKNIAIFCDGTWQNLSQRYPTNVTRLARATTPVAKDGAREVPQVIYYDDGVGVGNGVVDSAQRLLGGAFGEGLDAKIAQAYEFLCLNYCPGDRIFVFGFSRGAYTARSLVGLLRRTWILKRRNIGLVDQAIDIYRNHSKDAVETAVFRENNCFPMSFDMGGRPASPKAAASAANPSTATVQFVGVWDTVGSLGVPKALPFAGLLNNKYRFHDEALSRFVISARHAVAIDERRTAFAPTLWDNLDALNANASASALPYAQRPYQQVWFPGDHGAVGGGESDGGISLDPLLWIAEGASLAGLGFDADMIAMYRSSTDPTADFPASHRSIGEFLIDVAGEADRIGPDSTDEISGAATTRWRALRAYRPKPLRRWKAFLDEQPAVTV
ncbi:MAG TPA: DUF2235 domain-containing protein [Caulobacteraceae bacterium]|jgi:uncharacterized protein (DUF2235 family)